MIASFRRAALIVLRRLLPRSLKRELKRFWDPNQVMSPGEARIAMARRRSQHEKTAAIIEPKIPIICLSIFDWRFRWQRPQQLMSELARRGHAVFYVSRTSIASRKPVRLRSLQAGVEEVELRLPRPLMEAEGTGVDASFVGGAIDSLTALRRERSLAEAALIVQIPTWGSIALEARRRFGWRVLYDCMDDWEHFPGLAEEAASLEQELMREADAVVVSSETLRKKFEHAARRIEVIRNGVDLEHFRESTGEPLLSEMKGPVIGYVGAIAEWFDVDLVAAVARARPDYQLVLVGRVTVPVTPLESLSNVHLIGEKPYELVPAYMSRFDVGLIPFRLTPLTAATDPVKLYEYLALGKPVVATPLPEVIAVALVDVEGDPRTFADAIDRALAENSEEEKRNRIAFAQTCGWSGRTDAFQAQLAAAHPRVSIIIVTWNNLAYNQLCLESVVRNSLYPNFEIIVIDNGSSDGTPDYLRGLMTTNPRLRVELNADNRGFAAANNQGLAMATGERLILLNNDTVVPSGWLTRLTKHLDGPAIGLVVPVTNFSGNESRIEVPYRDLTEMDVFSDTYTSAHEGRIFDIRVAAMYCLAMRHDVATAIGPLDERFTVGMFEDDDYSQRARLAGYRVICAEDAFVHHFGQASFGRLSSADYQKIFADNKLRFEQKWRVSWEPHSSRPSHGDSC